MEKNKLTIGYSSTGPTAVGLWTAQEIGAFNKYGVEGNFVFISSSPVMVPALIGGDVQCAVAGANAVIAAALGGAPIVSVATLPMAGTRTTHRGDISEFPVADSAPTSKIHVQV